MILSAAGNPTIAVGAINVITGDSESIANMIDADKFNEDVRTGAAYFSAGASTSPQASTTSSNTIESTLFGITSGRFEATNSSVAHEPRVHLYSNVVYASVTETLNVNA
jgi:hypothetical protein